MEFVALDVETANEDQSSICSIGLVHFCNGQATLEAHHYVDPQMPFSGFNTALHGISSEQVKGKDIFPMILQKIEPSIAGKIVVHHGSFDRTAFRRARERYGLAADDWGWLNTLPVARRAWPGQEGQGYGLMKLASAFSVPLERHHDALADARCCGQILVRAIAETNLSPEAWIDRVQLPISLNARERVHLEPNPAGEFFGEAIVFTGALPGGVTRAEASVAATELGFQVLDNVNKATTVLCFGEWSPEAIRHQAGSSKYRKAMSLLEAGAPIRLITGADFIALLK